MNQIKWGVRGIFVSFNPWLKKYLICLELTILTLTCTCKINQSIKS